MTFRTGTNYFNIAASTPVLTESEERLSKSKFIEATLGSHRKFTKYTVEDISHYGPIEELLESTSTHLGLFPWDFDSEEAIFLFVLTAAGKNIEALDERLPPSAILEQDMIMQIRCYRLSSPVPLAEPKLWEIGNYFDTWTPPPLRFSRAPLPGTDNWYLIHDDVSISYTLDEIYEALGLGRGNPSGTATSESPQNAAVQQIREKLQSLPNAPAKQAIEEIVADIAKLDDEYYEECLLKELHQKIKKPKLSTLCVMLANIKRPANGAASYEYDAEGRVIYKYQGTYDEDFCLGLIRTTMSQVNTHHGKTPRPKPEPHITCMLGSPMRLRNRNGVISFEKLTEASFHAEVCENFMVKDVKNGGARKFAPNALSSICYNTAEKYLPQTPELITTPVFAPDLTLITKPSWYRNGNAKKPAFNFNILLAKTELKVPEVSPEPSDRDITKALRLLREDLLGEFPFFSLVDGKETRGPAEANALAMLLTQFSRRLIDGCAPMFFVSKPVPGTGGTLLARLPMLIAGREVASIHIGQNEDEVAKALVASILESRMQMFFDNVKNFNSPLLLQALTSRKVGGRLLGHSQMIERDNNFLWTATGNNPIILEEMARRICWITLNAKTADVRGRKFKRNLEVWVTQNRAEIIWALLTLVQAWIANKQPRFTERTLPSFDEWAAITGGILGNVGITDFLNTPKRVAVDADQNDARQFVRTWFRIHGWTGVTSKKLAELANNWELGVWAGKNDEEKRSKFAAVLDAIEGRTFDLELTEDGKPKKSVMVRRTITIDDDITYSLVDPDGSANG